MRTPEDIQREIAELERELSVYTLAAIKLDGGQRFHVVNSDLPGKIHIGIIDELDIYHLAFVDRKQMESIIYQMNYRMERAK